MRKKTIRPYLVFTGAVLLCLFLGCQTGCNASKNDAPSVRDAPKTTAGTINGSAKNVMMTGRSVMGGWFSHWTGDTSKPYRKDGLTLYYREIDGPDSIVESVKTRLEEDGGKANIVFFKLCFVDFDGGDRAAAKDNLKRNKEYIGKVYELVVNKHGKKLVVGNALPQLKRDTSADLVWNHREYNKWLDEFAAAHPGQVSVFDQYGVLADANGNLKGDYATATDDSHPNDAGYSALDDPLFQLLKTL